VERRGRSGADVALGFDEEGGLWGREGYDVFASRKSSGVTSGFEEC